MTKKTKILTLSLAATIGVSAIGVSVYFIVDQLTKPAVSTNVYNDVATNLSQTASDDFDRNALDFYEDNTGTMFVSRSSGSSSSVSGEMGTIWNYSSTLGTYFFATNIHVVSSALIGSAKEGNIRLNPDFDFLIKTRQMNSRKKIFPLIEKICAFGDLNEVSQATIISNPEVRKNSWYSDFVILSTTTELFKQDNTVNFLDSDAEYEWLADKIQSVNNSKEEALVFYICGYPGGAGNWPDAAIWTTVKYIWKPQSYYGKYPNISSAAKTLGIGYLNPNSESGQDFGNPVTWYKNYSSQLILPKLNLGGGSSGSLVTVKYLNPTTKVNELMAIGIYWGGYSSSDGENSEPFLGGVDLFYASTFAYSVNPDIKLNYSNLLASN